MDELTNEMLATAIKYLSAKRQNLYLSVTDKRYNLDPAQHEHLNSEIDDLNDVIRVLEGERERRRLQVAS